MVKSNSADYLFVQAQKVLRGSKEGDSIAVNGVCLTIISLPKEGFSVGVMPETLSRSNLGKLHHGDHVNLERAVTPDTRLGGHFVLGHVDDMGGVESITSVGTSSRIMHISAPQKLMPYMVEKGFVAVDGLSLTIVSVGGNFFTVSLVPYTLDHTTMRMKKPHDLVNLEVDILAKYVERLKGKINNELTPDFLREYGFAQ